jgi:O-antigen/teichoic acid export membrane protein
VTLRQRATTGVFWVGLSAAANSVFAMLIKYVLARMLLPAQFGLVAMAGLAIDLLQMFREMGFSSALIYRKGDVRKAADTMFTVVLLIAAVLFALAFLGAPLVAVFFRTPELTAVLRVLALTMIISAFGEVQFSLLAKNLAFRERLLPDLVPTVAYGVVAISLALMNMGVWSLVIAKIVDSVLTSLLAWIVVPWWRPKLRFDRQEARELLDYGKHIVGSSVLVYFITNLDNTFVGRVLGQEQLGFYGIAYTQANLPARQISSVIGQVLFPAYSQIKDDQAFMRRAFFRTLHYVALLATPITVAMVAFADPFVNMVYGATWAPTIRPLQILAIYGLLRALAVNMGSVFRAAGKPQWLTYIAVWRLAVMGIFLYPATRYFGIVGVSVLSSVVSIVDFFISATLTSKVIHGKLSDYVQALWLSTVVSLLSGAAGIWAYDHMSGAHDFIALVMAGTVMVGVYALIVIVFDAEARRLIQGLLVDVDHLRRGLDSTG